mgnify:CR=1 FL=1
MAPEELEHDINVPYGNYCRYARFVYSKGIKNANNNLIAPLIS